MANPTGMRELMLVADHDAASLHEIETMLTDEDYRVLSVRDAFEAISIYARLWAAIDLVVLDFSMPMMSGELIFDELQAINPNVAVVISSGFLAPGEAQPDAGPGVERFSAQAVQPREADPADQAGAGPPSAHRRREPVVGPPGRSSGHHT